MQYNTAYNVGGGDQESMTACWPVNRAQTTQGSLLPPLPLECLSACLCHKDAAPRRPTWGSYVLRPCGYYMWLTQLRPLYKILKFWQGGYGDLLILELSYTSLMFPCLLNLPPTSQEWFTSFFSFSLCSVSNFIQEAPVVANQHILIYFIFFMTLRGIQYEYPH